jgi:glycerophosphoryl diester phosphodiesterase
MSHPYFDLEGPIVLGHRGAAGDAPENTLVAFERGLALGAHIIESDIHGTRDGVPVLIHDPEVDRTTNGRGRVCDLTFEALQALDAGYRFDPDLDESFPFRGQGIVVPSLEQAFTSFPLARFNLEIKSEAPEVTERVVALVQDQGREATTLLTAGENSTMTLLRECLTRRRCRPALGASLADILSVVNAAVEQRPPETDSMVLQIPRAFAGRDLVTPALIAHCRAHGIQIHVWTINEPDEIRELIALGVDGIVTDHPGRMVALLPELRASAPRG